MDAVGCKLSVFQLMLRSYVSCEFCDEYLDYKKLSYRRGTARCVVSIKILPVAMQQCRNYLYDKF